MCDVPREESVHADPGTLGSPPPPGDLRYLGSGCAVVSIL